jgi:septum site-determining protein MinD
MGGTVLAVTSGKGGVGKSTTALNLGAALGEDGFSVALLDADLGMANIGAMLDVRTDPTLHDVLAGRADVEAAVVSTQEAMDIVPGGRDLAEYAEADPDRLPGVLATLAEMYDYVIADAGAGLGYVNVVPVEAADEVILVTTPDDAAVGDTAKIAAFAGRVDAEIRGAVVTQVGEDADPEAIAADVGTELLGVVPEDPSVPVSVDAGVPIEQYASDSPASVAYRQLARVVSGRSSGPARGTPASHRDTQEGDPGKAPRSTGGDATDTGVSKASTGVDSAPAGGGISDADGWDADDESDGETGSGLLSRLRGLF